MGAAAKPKNGRVTPPARTFERVTSGTGRVPLDALLWLDNNLRGQQVLAKIGDREFRGTALTVIAVLDALDEAITEAGGRPDVPVADASSAENR